MFIPTRASEDVEFDFFSGDPQLDHLIRSYAVLESSFRSRLRQCRGQIEWSKGTRRALKIALDRGVISRNDYNEDFWPLKLCITNTAAEKNGSEITGRPPAIFALDSFEDFPDSELPVVSGTLSGDREEIWKYWNTLQMLSLHTSIHDLYFLKRILEPVEFNDSLGAYWFMRKLSSAESMRPKSRIVICAGFFDEDFLDRRNLRQRIENRVKPIEQYLSPGHSLEIYLLPFGTARKDLHSRDIYFKPSATETVMLNIGTSIDVFNENRRKKNDKWAITSGKKVVQFATEGYELERKFTNRAEKDGVVVVLEG